MPTPVVVAPVMNAMMWSNVGVRRNAQRLREDGMSIVEPMLIFSAATLAEQDVSMYGGLGTLWRGPYAVMQTFSAVMTHHEEHLGQ